MHDEEWEMQHDISKLWDQVQQIFLLQRVTKNELKDKIEGLKDGLKSDMEAKMDGLMNGLKEYMEVLKEGLTKLLQEMLPNCEKVFHEIHDENKGNFHHDFRNSNFGLKTNHILNIDMRKFDGVDT